MRFDEAIDTIRMSERNPSRSETANGYTRTVSPAGSVLRSSTFRLVGFGSKAMTRPVFPHAAGGQQRVVADVGPDVHEYAAGVQALPQTIRHVRLVRPG